MTGKFSDWIAGAQEYRLALIVAGAGSLMLAVLLLASSWLISGDSAPSTGSSARKSAPIYHLPSRPARQPAAGTMKNKKLPAAVRVPRRQENSAPAQRKAVVASSQRPEDVATGVRKSDVKKLPNGYYVQTGAFRNSASAKKLAATLKRSGWRAHTLFKDNGLFAVLVGPSPTRPEARNAKRKLALNLHIKGFIVHTPRGN